eukprot:8071314-Pyramimonas_sp.AAC.1
MRDRRRAFATWASNCEAGRIKPLFSFTKPAGVPRAQVHRHGGSTSSAQHVADDQMDRWASIWRATAVSQPPTLVQVNGAGQGMDDYQVQHIEDSDDTADLREAFLSLPKAALPVPKIAE